MAEDESIDPEAPAPEVDASTPEAGPPKVAIGPRRTAKFRAGLVERLPKLSYSAWSVKDDLKIDAEWGTVINLKADSILGPLEPFAPGRRA